METPDIIIKIEKDDENYFTQQSEEEDRKGNLNDPPKNLPIITSVFSLNVKQEDVNVKQEDVNVKQEDVNVKQEDDPPLIGRVKSEMPEQIHLPETELSSESRPATRITSRYHSSTVSNLNREPNSAEDSPLSSDLGQASAVAALVCQRLSSVVMDKITIQNLIIRKSQRLSFIKNDGTSAVWKSFVVIYVDDQNSGFAMCKTCKTAIKWRSRDGTSGLKGHKTSCEQKCQQKRTQKNTGNVLSKANKTDEPARTTSKSARAKAEIIDAVASMCAIDIRPFSTVEGTGFTRLAEKLISIGAKYGQLPADKILPSAKTVSRYISTVAEKEKVALSDALRQQIKFGVTTDLWTEDGTGIPYITVTAQYIDEEFCLHSRILATRTLLEKHIANIRSIVKDILQSFGAYRQDNIYVTDSGDHIKAAFKDQQWISCAGHNLNLVLAHGLKDDNVESDSAVAEVGGLIKLSKNIVTYVKHSRIHQKLDTCLKQAVPTRWNGIYKMLVSISKNLAHLRQLATEFNDIKLQNLLRDLNESLLNDIICVLSAFDAATTVLSVDHTPTICNVLPSRVQLLKHLTITATDSSIVAGIKEHLQNLIDIYFPVLPLHSVGSLLHPRLKDNPIIFPDDIKTQAIESLRRLYQDQINTKSSSPSTSTTQDPLESTFSEGVTSVEEPPSKRMKIDVSSFLSDFYGTMSSLNANELDSYLCSSASDNDVLAYWRNKQKCWPELAKLARGILCIPATSTSSERSFSVAGRTVEERRARLNPEIVDDLLFFHGLKRS